MAGRASKVALITDAGGRKGIVRATAVELAVQAAEATSLTGAHVSGLPWFSVAAQMHDHSMTVAGVPARSYCWNSETSIERFKQVGNAAGMEATLALISKRERAVSEEIAKRVHYIELTIRPRFSSWFPRALQFPAERR
jgi:hypothetical protein